MNRLSLKRSLIFAGVFMMLFFRVSSCFASAFLDPDTAFNLRAELNSSRTIVLHWTIAKGYKLYRDKVTVGVESGKAPFQAPVLPKGIIFSMPTTGEKLDIYHDQLHLELPLVKTVVPFTLIVEYQGCAEDGLCYAPVTKSFKVDPARPGLLSTGG